MIRFWLCLFIIALSGYIGRLKSKKLKVRVQCMSEMKEILHCLQADMKNEMMTIMQALLKESYTAKIFGKLLANCAHELKTHPGKAFCAIWEEEIASQIKDDTALNMLGREEIGLIQKTGKSLVNASMHTQDAYFKMLYQDYDAMTEKVKQEADKKTRLYNSLGLMGGFFIAILLI